MKVSISLNWRYTEPLHHLLTDALAGDLPLHGVLEILLDLGGNALQFCQRHGALFTGADHAAQHLAALEALAASVLFHHHHGKALHRFIGSEASGAGKALSAAADAGIFISGARVDDFALAVSAIGTFHSGTSHIQR